MRSLVLPTPAPCFAELKGEPDWSFPNECRRQQRQILITNQIACCAWCEQFIDIDTSHIDHIKSRNAEPTRTFDPQNIVASCGSNSGIHCGHTRSSASLPDEFDLYTVPDIQQYFRVQIDGTLVIEPMNLALTAVETMQDGINNELKLNCRVLKGKRERRLAQLNDTLNGGASASDLHDIYTDFISLTEQVCES